MKKLAAILLTGIMTFSMAFTASASSKTDGKDMEAKAPDNDMVVAMQADATHLDPHVSSNGYSNTITNAMYETLLTFNEDSEVVPLLAKDWSVSEDGKSYTFHLNEGITFHDGEAFNAESVKAVYERGLADDSLTLQRTINSWEGVTVDDEYTVTINLKEPNNTFINKITQFRIVSKAGMDQGKDYLSKTSCGTGPFILEERVDGGYTKLVRNENYWQDGPTVDTLTFQVVPEDGSRIAMLQTGEADIIMPLPAIDVERIESDPTIIIDNFPSITYRYVTLNTQWENADGQKPFADKRVRQALNYAFDSEAYAKVVFNGYAVEPTSIFSENIMYFSPQTPYKPDLEKAKALMEEAGFADGFDCQIIVDNTTIEQKGAEFVKQQLAQINVNVELLPNESTANAELTSAPLEETTVQMWYVNWGSGSYEADGSMRNILHGEKFPPDGYNTAFWNNEEFNNLLDEALKMTDTDEIAEAYAKAQAIAWDECPWIFLGNDNSLNAYKSYVTGMQYKPAGEIVFTTIGLNL
ncbi:MAG: ABC transporter substrate-binding protein [Eubacteriales bacterium]|nr:ABC transporter substrate-binding protein [Eubacteriales bacterium]